jgi:hypothetical protein
MIRNWKFILSFVFIYAFKANAQSLVPFSSELVLKNPLGLKARSGLGPVIGVERGKFTFITLGGEIYKTYGLLKPKKITGGFQIQYNFGHNVIGYRLYSFYKRGRLGLTYGLGLNYITDFTNHRYGISPQIGYKLFNLHLYAGANLTLGSADLQNFNKLFIGLNLFIPTKHRLLK